MSAAFEPQTEHKRLHASSPLFMLIDAIIKVIFPLLVTYFAPGSSYFFTQGWLVGGIAVLATLAMVVQYWFYRYWIEADRLVVKSGILFKELRQVPFERIQNVNIKATPLHKIFGVATVQIESASGSKPEAVLRVLTQAAIAELQDATRLAQEGESVAPSKSDSIEPETIAKPDESGETLFAMTPKAVTTYGSIYWQALVPLAALVGFAMQSESMRDKLASWALSMVFYIKNHTALAGKWVNFLVIGLVITLAAWLISVAIAHFKLHGFTLTKRKDKLHAEMGLFTKITANIPIKRIQLIRINMTLLHRLFKRQTLVMETAGGVTQQTGIVMRWLAPLAEPKVVSELLKEIEPEIDTEKWQWEPLSPLAWRRLLKIMSFWILSLTALLTWLWTPHCALFLLTCPLWVWYARAWADWAGFVHNDHLLAYRSGVFFRHISIVKIGKVQTVHMTESPFDRHNKHGGLWVDTAGSNMAAHHVSIPYLEKPQLMALYRNLSSQVSNSQFKW